jgi:hypothetical protein
MADKADKETTAKVRRQPSKISRLMENSDTRIVRRAHMDYYGMEVTDRFIRDLDAYVKNPVKTPSMLATGDAQTVVDTIRDIYGVRAPLEYANDLIAFSEKAAKGGSDNA